MKRHKQLAAVTRRDFMKTACGAAVAGATLPLFGADAESDLHEAMYYRKLDKSQVQCELCPTGCVVDDGRRGACRVRANHKGKYITLIYNRPCSMNMDPIEKKPFFHVYPGSQALSIATVGCNFTCKFCQNWEISQAEPDEFHKLAHTPVISPADIVKAALADRRKPKTISYTYTEPIIFFEYMLDCAKAAKEAGIGNVVVSNGYINEKPLKELCKTITAIKIDFKAFSQEFYKNTCSGRLQPVLDTLKRLSESGVWYEIVNLIIPTLNDDMDDIKKMTAWIVKELGPNVPVHFTRFFPKYQLRNLPATPPETLHKAHKIAVDAGCNYVYTGNMPGGEGEKTYCPKCKTVVIDRIGMYMEFDTLAKGKCPKCDNPIPGVWK